MIISSVAGTILSIRGIDSWGGEYPYKASNGVHGRLELKVVLYHHSTRPTSNHTTQVVLDTFVHPHNVPIHSGLLG